MFNHEQFQIEIIQPVLTALNMNFPGLQTLLIGTLAKESLGGTYLKQIKGPALGPFMMEPKTHDDLWNKELPNNPKLANGLMIACKMSTKPTADMLVFNLKYATAMAAVLYISRHQYKGIPESFPDDIRALSLIWKKYYNTELGKGTPQEFINAYYSFIGIKEPHHDLSKENGTIVSKSNKTKDKT